MARKAQRKGTNSVGRHIAAYASAGKFIEPPFGFKLKTEQEKHLWAAFTAARSHDDWMSHDLVMLVKIVHLEVDIRKIREVLDEEGMIILNARGTKVENAALRVYDTLLRMQLAAIRSLSINSTASEKSTVEKSAKEDQKALKKMQEAGAAGLLAMPGDIN